IDPRIEDLRVELPHHLVAVRVGRRIPKLENHHAFLLRGIHQGRRHAAPSTTTCSRISRVVRFLPKYLPRLAHGQSLRRHPASVCGGGRLKRHPASLASYRPDPDGTPPS